MADETYVPTFSKAQGGQNYVPSFARQGQDKAPVEQAYVPTFKKAVPATNVSRETKPPAPPGIVQQAKKVYGGDIADIGAEYKKQATEAGADVGKALTAKPTLASTARDIVTSTIPGAQMFNPTVQAAAKYVFTPFAAPIAATAGRATEAGEKAIGMTDKSGKPLYSKEYVGDLVSGFIPIGEGGMASRAARAAEAVRSSDAVQAVKAIFSPTTMSREAGRTEMAIRRATGEGDLAAEQAAQSVLKANKAVANLPMDQQRSLVNYIENRSRGVAPPPDPELKKAADAVASVSDKYRKRAEYILPEDARPNFIRDYYSHLWKEKPQQVEDTLNTMRSRQGSSRSFKARTIPTIAEGIQAGLTPRIENPIENTMAYARNMSKFLATHDMQNELKDLGYMKFYAPGKAPAGWKPVDGILTEKTGAYMTPAKEGAEETFVPKGSNTGEAIPMTPRGAPMKLHAPADVTRVYNNFISKGFESGEGAPIWAGARMASNAMTGLKLGLSAYHLSTMANEGIVSEIARGLQAASRGRLLTGAKAIAGAPLAPVRTALRGKRMGDELLNVKTPDSLSTKVNDAFVRSGGRVRMDPFYQSHGGGTFYQAIRKGTFGRELKDLANRVYQGPMLDKAKATIEAGAKAIQLAASPIFEMYVPAMKRGAFASNMEDWLKANPGATQEQIDRQAISLQDSIDNRFGEVVQDNLFWKRGMKQMAQILLLSPTWDLGTVREIGGGLKDAIPSLGKIGSKEGISKRTAYVAALAGWVAVMNSAAQYLKTGKPPQGRDFMAYRTGGTQQVGKQTVPERGMVPGYQKDVYAFGYDFPHHVIPEAINKLNPALSTTIDLGQNKDYRGLPITKPEGAPDMPGQPTLLDFLMDQFMPISLGSFEQRKKGTNISVPEQALGVRQAPAYVASPEAVEQQQKYFDTKDWRARLKADQRARERLEP